MQMVVSCHHQLHHYGATQRSTPSAGTTLVPAQPGCQPYPQPQVNAVTVLPAPARLSTPSWLSKTQFAHPWRSLHCQYSSHDWGPYSMPEGSGRSAAQRLFMRALQQPMGELSLDFDRVYLAHRRGRSSPSTSSSSSSASSGSDTELEPCLGPFSPAQDNALCDALLQFQSLVSGRAASSTSLSSTSCLLECCDLLAQHASPDCHSSQLHVVQAEVDRLEHYVLCELQQQQPACQHGAADGAGPQTTHQQAKGIAAGLSSNGRVVNSTSRLRDHDSSSQAQRMDCCTAEHAPYPSAAAAPAAASATAAAPAAASATATTRGNQGLAYPGLVDLPTATALVQAVNRAVYVHGGYGGACRDFYSPESHLLHMVVANKSGSPAALAVLYWEVGRRVGLPLEVLLLPGHTFLRPCVTGGCSWLVDPFNGGQVCSQAVVEARLNSNWGLQAPCITLGDASAILPAQLQAADTAHGPPHSYAASGSGASPAHSCECARSMPHAGPHTGSPAADSSNSHGLQDHPCQGSRCSASPPATGHGNASGRSMMQQHSSASQHSEPGGGATRVDSSTWRLHGGSQPTATEGHAAAGSLSGDVAAAGRVVWGMGPQATPGRLLHRLLSNLRESYFCPLPTSGFQRWGSSASCGHLSNRVVVWRALWATRFARALTPDVHHLVRDEGYALMQLGACREGMALLKQYLRLVPHAPDASRVKEFIVPDA